MLIKVNQYRGHQPVHLEIVVAQPLQEQPVKLTINKYKAVLFSLIQLTLIAVAGKNRADLVQEVADEKYFDDPFSADVKNMRVLERFIEE